jgi:hypothetical protein
VYSDPEGWLQLADAYASLGLLSLPLPRPLHLFALFALWKLIQSHLIQSTPSPMRCSPRALRYEQSLSALEDLILIQPENTFHILRYAETAYTAGEYELCVQNCHCPTPCVKNRA